MTTLETPGVRAEREASNSFVLVIDHGRRHSQVTAGGDLDNEHAWHVRDCLRELVDRGVYQIVLEVGAVRVVEFAALGILIGGLVKAEGRGAEIVVLPPNSTTHKLLKRAGLRPRLEFADAD